MKVAGATVRRSGLSVALSALMALLLVALGWVVQNNITIPPNTLPWRPVVLDSPPGWIAHWQLNRLAADGAVCRQALAQSRLRFTPVADRPIRNDCGWTDAIRIDESPVRLAPGVTAACGLTAALYWYQRQLEPIARQHMGSDLVRIDQIGVFACRNVNSEAVGSRSQHATANAIDVASFQFADGRRVSILSDYGKPTDAGRFLDAARDQACALFDVVLGPRYNRLHADHFHFDMGNWRHCS